MEILDTPVNLNFKNGKFFPSNVVFMGYVFMLVSIFILLSNVYFGLAALIVSTFICFTTVGVTIDLNSTQLKEYISLFGFLRTGKSTSYKKFNYITAIPTKGTNTMYSRTNSSTSYTDYYFSVFLLDERYRNKKEVTRFEKKSMSTDLAKELAHPMDLTYFEYDPKLIREKLLRR